MNRERQELEDKGLTRLDYRIEDSVVAPIRERILRKLSETKNSNPLDNAKPAKLKSLQKSEGIMGPLISQELKQQLNKLVDNRSLVRLPPHHQILLTLPYQKIMGGQCTNWEIPSNVWHTDVPRAKSLGIPGIQIFVFLDQVKSRSGGTLLVEGTHRLLNNHAHMSSKRFKQLLKREPYFNDLMNNQKPNPIKLLAEHHQIGGVPVKVTELTGQPGEVFVADLRLLHTVSDNASSQTRIMMTQRFFFEDRREMLEHLWSDKALQTPAS